MGKRYWVVVRVVGPVPSPGVPLSPRRCPSRFAPQPRPIRRTEGRKGTRRHAQRLGSTSVASVCSCENGSDGSTCCPPQRPSRPSVKRSGALERNPNPCHPCNPWFKPSDPFFTGGNGGKGVEPRPDEPCHRRTRRAQRKGAQRQSEVPSPSSLTRSPARSGNLLGRVSPRGAPGRNTGPTTRPLTTNRARGPSDKRTRTKRSLSRLPPQP